MPERVAIIMTKPGSDLEDLLYLFYPETDEARAMGLDHDVARDLATITAPVLYAGGAHDVMIDAFSSYAAVQVLPNAKLVLYSDAGHAFVFQHLDKFMREVLMFLAD